MRFLEQRLQPAKSNQIAILRITLCYELRVSTFAAEPFPTPSPDGNTLCFNRSTTFDSQDSNIRVTTRADAHSSWASVNLEFIEV